MNTHGQGTILVPVDFSWESTYAIDHAVAMAKNFGYNIFLLNIISKRQKGSDREREAEQNLTGLTQKIARDPALHVSHMLKSGTVTTVICETAEQLNADFIVMGAATHKGIKHLVGSYPYRLVCASSVPTLVVKDRHQHVGYHNIVIPIDFTRRSTQKITQAAKFSRFFGARIRVFGFLSSQNKAKIINKEALLKRVTDFFANNDVPVTADLLINPDYSWPEALLRFADQVHADLIMIVAEKGNRIQEIFTQNYAERILDKSTVPVLSIVPREEDIKAESDDSGQGLISPFVDPLGLILRPGGSI